MKRHEVEKKNEKYLSKIEKKNETQVVND